MKVFETIISILEEKCSLSIPLICHEVNQQLIAKRSKPILPSQIKSIVTRKKDIFLEQEGYISIQPDKYPFTLFAKVDGDNGITYQVNINFSKKTFSFIEWRNVGALNQKKGYHPRKIGDFEIFKREIFAMKIWEWNRDYGPVNGITLGKTNWMVKLKTKSKIYVSEGTDFYPENWPKFCKAIERLTGSAFQ